MVRRTDRWLQVEDPHLGRILVPADELAARVAALGEEITEDYEGRPPLLVGRAQGRVHVHERSLPRTSTCPVEFDFMAVSSYGSRHPHQRRGPHRQGPGHRPHRPARAPGRGHRRQRPHPPLPQAEPAGPQPGQPGDLRPPAAGGAPPTGPASSTSGSRSRPTSSSATASTWRSATATSPTSAPTTKRLRELTDGRWTSSTAHRGSRPRDPGRHRRGPGPRRSPRHAVARGPHVRGDLRRAARGPDQHLDTSPSTPATTRWSWSATSRCPRPASTTWSRSSGRPTWPTSPTTTGGSPACPSWPGWSTPTPVAPRSRSD